MRIDLVKIGNSQGFRIPKTVIEQAQLTGELDLEVSPGAIVIRSVKQPRQGWEQAAAACHSAGEDQLEAWDTTVSDFDGSWTLDGPSS